MLDATRVAGVDWTTRVIAWQSNEILRNLFFLVSRVEASCLAELSSFAHLLPLDKVMHAHDWLVGISNKSLADKTKQQ